MDELRGFKDKVDITNIWQKVEDEWDMLNSILQECLRGYEVGEFITKFWNDNRKKIF